jgi:prepilin-type N-terminal cleavage/methylation domain-containing protein
MTHPTATTRPFARLPARRAFTLIEVLISMTILSILVLLMLQFLAGTQKLWRINRTNIRIYENSRVAFEVVERDMRSSMTSDISDKQVGFWVNGAYDSTAASTSQLCTFVSSVEHHEDADSRLCEIAYKFHTQYGAPMGSQGLVPPAFTFARQMTCDNDDDNWNFTGRPANWMYNTAGTPRTFEDVISGVESMEIIYYNEVDALVTPDALGNLTIPYRVEVNIVLFDETMTEAPAEVRFQTRRSFTKILYLGDLKTN